MATNIEFRNGKYSFVESIKQEVAWHGLGTHYSERIVAQEALKNCGADFQVGLQPIAALTPELYDLIERGIMINPVDLQKAIITGKKATMRYDVNETLGVVSDAYGVVQNAHAFDFVDMLCTGEIGSETPIIESAGVLGRGERIFITAKFPEPVRLAHKDDVVDMYIVFTTSHDGTGSVNAMVTPIRVVCNNTLNLAMSRNEGKLSLRHTRFIGDRLDLTNKDNANRAYQTLKLYNTYKEFFEEKLAELGKKMVTDKQIEDILAKVLYPKDSYDIFKKTGNVFHEDISTRAKNMYTNMRSSLDNGVGQDLGEKGTALWVLNGLTTHYQNGENWNGNDLKKFDSIMEGTVQKRLQETYELLTAVV